MTPDVVAFLYSFTQEAMWRLMLGGAIGGAFAGMFVGPSILRAGAWCWSKLSAWLWSWVRVDPETRRLAACPCCNGSGVSPAAYRARLKASRQASKAA